MLVLTRRSGDALRIDGDIRVVVLGVTGGQVRIGIEAPSDCNVLREELHERIARANLASASPSGPPAPEAAETEEKEDIDPKNPSELPGGANQ